MTSRALARAGLVVTLAFLGSRVLGWIRLFVIGDQFGAGAELDAYFAAFRIPDLLYQLVAAGAVASALIPVLSGLLHAGDASRAWRVTSTVINLMLLALALLCAVVALAAPAIVPALVPGFDAATTELTVKLTRLMLLSPILLALGAVASALLNVQGSFGAAALAPILYNACIIAAAIALAPMMGIDSLAVGVVAGSFAHLAIQLPPLRGRFRYSVTIDLRDAAARQTLLLMAPRAIGLGVAQITFAVNTTLATGLAVGSVVAYNVAFTILQIPLGVIGFPLGVVLLPSLSRAMAAGDTREFGALITGSLRLLLWATIFLAVVGMVLASQVVIVLFGGGFDGPALSLTAHTLLYFQVGLPAHALNVVLARAFYSAQDTRTPVAVAVLSVAINVVVSILMVGGLGLAGLALGIAVGGWAEAAILAAILWRRTRSFALRPITLAGLEFLAGSLIAAAVAGGALLLLEGTLSEGAPRLAALVELIVAGAAATACYLLYSRLVRIPELARALGLVRSALRRG